MTMEHHANVKVFLFCFVNVKVFLFVFNIFGYIFISLFCIYFMYSYN